ncbi:hypothetical protein, partial [Sphingomonas segetis]|uniref:hypothetical protein n=1 Tax=Sphingomonas segetis TaxID=1104779 RepID=UPI001E5FA51B
MRQQRGAADGGIRSDRRRGHGRGCPINDEDSRRAAIIEQLMCNFRAHLGTVDVAVDHLQAD